MERTLQFPLPYKEPHSALILSYYPLLNKIFNQSLQHLDDTRKQLKKWKPNLNALSKWVDTSNIHQNENSEAGRAIHALGILRNNILIFLSKVYMAVEAFVNLPPEVVPSARALLESIDGTFSDLEASVRDSQVASFESVGVPSFWKIPTKWKKLTDDYGIKLTSIVIDRNAKLLDTYLSAMVLKFTKPKKRTWIYYTIGGIGVSVFLVWLLKQEYNETSHHEALTNFLINHVKKPLLQLMSIREDIFKRSRKNQTEENDIKEASDVYRIMLVKFTGWKSSTDNDMFNDVRRSLKEHFEHPLKSVLNGRLIRGIIIRLQRLFLDYEIGKQGIITFVRDNKLSFAMFSALPAILLFYGLSYGYVAMTFLSRTILYFIFQRSGARELDRDMTRSLIADVEKAVIDHLVYEHEGKDWENFGEEDWKKYEKDVQHLHGLVLHELDRFYRKIENHATSMQEWESLEREVVYLGTTGQNKEQKLACLQRLHNFKCTSLRS